jgi:hypothetical protein
MERTNITRVIKAEKRQVSEGEYFVMVERQDSINRAGT